MKSKENFENCINTYKSLKQPGYAVLVTGDWGVGKTHSIKECLKNNEMYYVSLFGTNNADEIHADLFAKMHPVKSVAKILSRGVLSTVNISGINLKLSDLGDSIIKKIISDDIKNDRVIVFDDLERSSLNSKELLGVINKYVEHYKCHVIAITHDEKLEDQFKEMKEKVFGYTVKLHPDLDNAFISFIENKISKETLEKYREHITGIFKQSECKSLRILNEIIINLDLLYRCLKNEHLEYEKIILDMTSMFVAICIEVKKSSLVEKDLRAKSSYEIFDSTLVKKLEKYNGINFYNPVLTNDILADILFNGVFNPNEIEESVNNIILMTKGSSNIKSWKKIYNLSQLDQNVVNNAVSDIQKTFSEKLEKNEGDLLHVFSCMLMFSTLKVINIDFDDTFIKCKDYIDYLYEQDELPYNNLISNDYNYRNDFSYDGYSYLFFEEYVDKKKLNELKEYFNKRTEDCLIKQYPKFAEDIISKLDNNVNEFGNLITRNHQYEGMYSSIAILAEIPPKTFVKKWLSKPPQQQAIINKALLTRYCHDNVVNLEMEWLKDIIENIEATNDNKIGLEKVRIKWMIHALKEIVDKHKNKQSKQYEGIE
ncbi:MULTISPECIES: P-loop NTPase fold protein [Photorhabdus]|nr:MULTISPECIES: P-loop NTPase fold protein [Photorhabdus]NDL05829.1 hypothetical protein [Photorhabdus bodei]NDL10080.1 hypothetical protein [Photorhabdus bodei]